MVDLTKKTLLKKIKKQNYLKTLIRKLPRQQQINIVNLKLNKVFLHPFHNV